MAAHHPEVAETYGLPPLHELAERKVVCLAPDACRSQALTETMLQPPDPQEEEQLIEAAMDARDLGFT